MFSLTDLCAHVRLCLCEEREWKKEKKEMLMEIPPPRLGINKKGVHLLKQQLLIRLPLLNFAAFLLTPPPHSSLFECFPLRWYTLDVLFH